VLRLARPPARPRRPRPPVRKFMSEKNCGPARHCGEASKCRAGSYYRPFLYLWLGPHVTIAGPDDQLSRDFFR
jgi:hypothetical protein